MIIKFISSTTFQTMKNSSEYEDFAHEHDPVTKQYESLPYPPMSKNDVEKENQFYKKNAYIASFFRSNAFSTQR